MIMAFISLETKLGDIAQLAAILKYFQMSF